MASWQLQEAKARFSEVLDTAAKKGPQVITRRGVETAVIMSFTDWQKVSSAETKSPSKRQPESLTIAEKKDSEAFLKLLQSGPDFEIPQRGKMRLRKPVQF